MVLHHWHAFGAGDCVNARQAQKACTFPAPLQQHMVTPKQASSSVTGMLVPAE